MNDSNEARDELQIFARKLKESMAEQKITNQEMAEACGLRSESAIKKYKSAKRKPNLKRLQAMAQKLGKPVEELNQWLVLGILGHK